MENYIVAYFFAVFVIGIICVALGISTIVQSDEKRKKAQKANGIKLLILGSVLSIVFLVASLFVVNSKESLPYLWLFYLIVLPLCIFILIITLVFFTTIGYSFIQAGKADESDKRSATIGIVIVTLGLITVACLIMTFIYSGALLSQTITASRTKGGSSVSTSAQIIKSLIL